MSREPLALNQITADAHLSSGRLSFPGGVGQRISDDQSADERPKLCISRENGSPFPRFWLIFRVMSQVVLNVLGSELRPCCYEPRTGFYRDGYCRTGTEDSGLHILCAEMTEDFLKFSVSRGNDLITPRPEYQFPGLRPGDRWCLCVMRWVEAWRHHCAPPVLLDACPVSVLEFVPLATLRQFALASS